MSAAGIEPQRAPLAVLSSGELVFSDWVALDQPVPGILSALSLSTGQLRSIALPVPLHGPADFFYDSARQTLWIPAALDGIVSVVEVR